MSKRHPRSKFARELAKAAASLGYDREWTTTGHLRFVHRDTGRTVIAPSKAGGRLEKNAYAELERGMAIRGTA